MTQIYRALRAELARTTAQHWGVLRLIAATPDPRCVAAEAVATHATHIMQLPAIWTALHLQEAISAQAHEKASRQIEQLQLSVSTAAEIAELGRAIDALDQAARAWCSLAYHQPPPPRRTGQGRLTTRACPRT